MLYLPAFGLTEEKIMLPPQFCLLGLCGPPPNCAFLALITLSSSSYPATSQRPLWVSGFPTNFGFLKYLSLKIIFASLCRALHSLTFVFRFIETAESHQRRGRSENTIAARNLVKCAAGLGILQGRTTSLCGLSWCDRVIVPSPRWRN